MSDCFADPFGPLTDPFPDTAALKMAISTQCPWALAPNYAMRDAMHHFWYVSAEKLEPRLGARFEEPGAHLETPLDIGRRIAALYADLPKAPCPIHRFITEFPQHLLAVERVQIATRYAYADIQDNLLAKDMRPIDMLRAKLAMFGAAKFDPKSTLWTRVTLAQGAPLWDEVTTGCCDDWWLACAPM